MAWAKVNEICPLASAWFKTLAAKVIGVRCGLLCKCSRSRGTRQGAPVGSLYVAQGAGGGAHAGGAAASGTTVSADPGAATLDLVCPAVGTGAVRHGQAGDRELDAVDGGGGGHRGPVRFALEV